MTAEIIEHGPNETVDYQIPIVGDTLSGDSVWSVENIVGGTAGQVVVSLSSDSADIARARVTATAATVGSTWLLHGVVTGASGQVRERYAVLRIVQR